MQGITHQDPIVDIKITAPIRMNGWHHDDVVCKEKLARGEMIHLVAETTNICNHDCEYCYTVEYVLSNSKYHVRKLPGELKIEERLKLIDQAAELGAVTYDVVGAGEPTIDPHLLTQIEYARDKGMIPVVFTNGYVLNEEMIERFWNAKASVVVKWHSKDWAKHDEMVRKTGAGERRDHALKLLMERGFNKTTPTRLAMDNIIYQKTIEEIPNWLRYCRNNNIFMVCSTFIPAGRTQKGNETEADFQDVVRLFQECRKIDKEEFGIEHSDKMPYIGYGQTCTQYMGLYVTIRGDVFGCVGQSESYDTIRNRSLKDIWRERFPLLQKYNGGCPPRQKFYQNRVTPEQIKQLF